MTSISRDTCLACLLEGNAATQLDAKVPVNTQASHSFPRVAFKTSSESTQPGAGICTRRGCSRGRIDGSASGSRPRFPCTRLIVG